jgi:hypothetical protein
MAVTPIGNASASSGAVPGMDQIDQAFGKMFSMFGSNTNNLTTPYGGGTGPGGVTPEPVSGSDNSLTAIWRGLSNLAGTSAPQLLQAGGNLIGGSMPVVQGGVDMSGTGFGTTQTALGTLQPSIDFYTQLLQGNPQATAQALAPTAANINAITQGATTAASQGQPMGGYRAATLAGLPFAQAAQVGNAALQLQPAAAAALGQLGGEQAQIGSEQAQIGQGVSQTGLGVGQLGTVLTGQGLQTLQNTIADVLNKMGINIQGGTAATFSQIVGAL